MDLQLTRAREAAYQAAAAARPRRRLILTTLSQQQFDSLLDFVLRVHSLSDDMSLFDAFEARRKSQAP